MNKPWFIRRSGPVRYRISPYAWQGWVISAVFILALALNMGFLRRYLLEHLSTASGVIVTIGLTVILLGSFIAIAVRFSVSEKSLNEDERKRG
jgi:hypothetical protein